MTTIRRNQQLAAFICFHTDHTYSQQMSLSSKNFQRKLENLESELLASRSVGVHDWAATELKALSQMIRESRRSNEGDENFDPNFHDLTMSSFLSRSMTPDESNHHQSTPESPYPKPPPHYNIPTVSPSVFVESELVDDSGFSIHSDPQPNEKSVPEICLKNLFHQKYEIIDLKLTPSEIEHARAGFLQFMTEREIAREKMIKSVIASRRKINSSPEKEIHQNDAVIVPPEIRATSTSVDDNSAIIRSAIAGTCLPGDSFKFQRDEIFHIMKQILCRYIILFSETNQFAGVYAVLDDNVAHRVYSIPDPYIVCPHQIVPAIVQRRFRYTFSSGFVEMGSRYNSRGFWDNLDAVTLKKLREMN